MKPPELFAALYQRFKLNLIRPAHNALYELGLRYKVPLILEEEMKNIGKNFFVVHMMLELRFLKAVYVSIHSNAP